jgi:hypothetical protein
MPTRRLDPDKYSKRRTDDHAEHRQSDKQNKQTETTVKHEHIAEPLENAKQL